MRPPITPTDVARFCQNYLPDFRKQGAEWRGPCPIHGGKNPSFAIHADTGGWFCHSKCGEGGSFRDLQERLGADEPAQASRRRTPVAIYDYTDEQGQLLYQCLRYDPKDFRQRRPDGNGAWL